jgi:hypothetical protein
MAIFFLKLVFIENNLIIIEMVNICWYLWELVIYFWGLWMVNITLRTINYCLSMCYSCPSQVEVPMFFCCFFFQNYDVGELIIIP